MINECLYILFFVCLYTVVYRRMIGIITITFPSFDCSFLSFVGFCYIIRRLEIVRLFSYTTACQKANQSFFEKNDRRNLRRLNSNGLFRLQCYLSFLWTIVFQSQFTFSFVFFVVCDRKINVSSTTCGWLT